MEELGRGLSFLYAPRSALEDASKASALRSLVKHSIKARHWADENSEEWIDSYYVESQGLTREVGKNIVDAEGTSAFFELDDELVDELQEAIDLLERSDALSVEVQADELFDPRFNEAIAEAVEESGAAHSAESRG